MPHTRPQYAAIERGVLVVSISVQLRARRLRQKSDRVRNQSHASSMTFRCERKTRSQTATPGDALSNPNTLENVWCLNESPNGAMYPTNVPPAFVWRDVDATNAVVNSDHGVHGVAPPSGKDIVVMWWQEACDTNCLIQYPGSDVAVLFDWRGEDSGPNVNSANDVLQLYAQARAKFPNATVRSGGLDDVAESLMRPTSQQASRARC